MQESGDSAGEGQGNGNGGDTLEDGEAVLLRDGAIEQQVQRQHAPHRGEEEGGGDDVSEGESGGSAEQECWGEERASEAAAQTIDQIESLN